MAAVLHRETDAAKVAPCLTTKPSDPACVREAIGTLAMRAYRRDVAAAELYGRELEQVFISRHGTSG